MLGRQGRNTQKYHQERRARAPLGIDCELGLDARAPVPVVVSSHRPQRYLQARRPPPDYVLLFLLFIIVIVIFVIIVVVIFIVAVVGVARLLLWPKGQPSLQAVPQLNRKAQEEERGYQLVCPPGERV